jgi:hypothetical protein
MQFLKQLLTALLIAAAMPASAQSLFHKAENEVPVALVGVTRAADHTEVRLQALQALEQVCWYASGVNSPYLLVDGQRYPLIGHGNVTPCPTRRSYANGEVMVLRFQPLPASARTVSLVEGQGGENQALNPAANRTERFWNFLRFPVN